jgi:hypothetical protein
VIRPPCGATRTPIQQFLQRNRVVAWPPPNWGLLCICALNLGHQNRNLRPVISGAMVNLCVRKILSYPCLRWVQTRSFGYVGSMSALAPLCGLKSDISLRPRSAISRHGRGANNSHGLTYSITLSARVRIAGGTLMASAAAVFRFTASVKRVGSSTGRSAGRAPLRIASASAAARR